MGWRFRQSFKIIPGLKLNLSKSGLSASIGGAPFTMNVGPRGVYGTASLPGSGVSFRQRLFAPGKERLQSDAYDIPERISPKSDRTPVGNFAPIKEIHSASTEALTSASLREFKTLIQTVYTEYEDISSELNRARIEATRTEKRFKSWDGGFLLKKVFKKSFERRSGAAEIAAARKSELEEQLQLTTITANVQFDTEQAETYYRMRDQFSALSECAAIWDVKAMQATDKFRERTIASAKIDRERVHFTLGSCDLFNWEQQVPYLRNAKGGDLYLFPGFILYRASKTAFSVIDFHDVKATVSTVRFHEEEALPSDSQKVGETWKKANKDGSRDMRFANNYPIPILAYGELTLKSDSGLWEVFHFSNPDRLQYFQKAWNIFVESFKGFNFDIHEKGEKQSLEPPTVNPQAPALPIDPRDIVHFECHKCGQHLETDAEAAGQEICVSNVR